MKVGRRLVDYALLYKKIILAALLMLTVSVAAELAGPFIAKKMIDDHILGIETSWYVTDKGEDAVSYRGEWYKREQYFTGSETKGEEVRVLQIGREFYFIPEAVTFDGKRSVKSGEITITKGEQSATYSAEKLSGDELLDFYNPEIPKIIKLIAFYFGLLVLASFFQYGQRFYLQKAANRVIQKMRNDIFQHIQKLPIRYFDNLPAGKVVARITNDTEAIRDLYVTVLSTFFTSTIYIIGIYIALFILDVKLAALCLILIPILVIWTYLYRIYASKYNHVIRSKVSDINAMINESIQGMNIIQAFSREKQTNEEFEELNGTHFKYQNKLLSLNSITSHNLVGVLRNVTFVAFIWYFGGGSIGVGSAVTLGVLYAFVDYINRLFQPVTGIVNQLANLEQALVAGERVFHLLDESGKDVADGKMDRYSGNVSFDHVFFGYKENEYVLKDITFEANQGDTVALVGHTGSGKSSIMNLLFRFYDANEGKIMIDGKSIKDIPYQTIREHMGIVLQDPYLFTGTIASNVSLDDPRISRETVEEALKAVGAERVFNNLEKGYDEPVIEKGSTLSSGQRQLISFARALAFNPAILILDEATSSIDTETEAVIQEAMEVLKKGRTTFIIAHRLSTIKNADQILVLDRGEIVEKGTHDDLMKSGGRYYQMYQLQQGTSGLAG
ncbi:ABC transporter ATP-binding protein [Bacillus haikouensis]|jgi:ATP-binding cassette, subfamily B, multidrug efflux pump|uniref:ABC transporter ATP-binding protein n=1 Tax=Bacillus haikouensis TaxID=1510468 RepID=UPI0015578941|nr:ABC transporter ATP-binding protein [Bacillus haikouensis]NQD68242.1 ABC transporter ATP-binding protein [Bacillus haikouensis]